MTNGNLAAKIDVPGRGGRLATLSVGRPQGAGDGEWECVAALTGPDGTDTLVGTGVDELDALIQGMGAARDLATKWAKDERVDKPGYLGDLPFDYEISEPKWRSR